MSKYVPPLEFQDISYSKFSLVRVGIFADNSCFFHCLALALSRDYATHICYTESRKKWISELRIDFANELKKHYSFLGRGKFSEFSQSVPEFSLENMISNLCSSKPVGTEIFELVSNVLDIDIYVFDLEKESVYPLGDSIFFQNRKSIILGYISNHYELIGRRTRRRNESCKCLPCRGVKVVFSPNSSIISLFRKQNFK
jgi:hypothetical protein